MARNVLILRKNRLSRKRKKFLKILEPSVRVDIRNTRRKCKICPKFTLKTLEQHH